MRARFFLVLAFFATSCDFHAYGTSDLSLEPVTVRRPLNLGRVPVGSRLDVDLDLTPRGSSAAPLIDVRVGDLVLTSTAPSYPGEVRVRATFTPQATGRTTSTIVIPAISAEGPLDLHHVIEVRAVPATVCAPCGRALSSDRAPGGLLRTTITGTCAPSRCVYRSWIHPCPGACERADAQLHKLGVPPVVARGDTVRVGVRLETDEGTSIAGAPIQVELEGQGVLRERQLVTNPAGEVEAIVETSREPGLQPTLIFTAPLEAFPLRVVIPVR